MMGAKSGKLSSSGNQHSYLEGFRIGKMLPDVLTSMKELGNIETFQSPQHLNRSIYIYNTKTVY